MKEKQVPGECSCYRCKRFAVLQKPWPVEHGNFIYGYCFKRKEINSKGFPVYIPNSSCKDFQKLAASDEGCNA